MYASKVGATIETLRIVFKNRDFVATFHSFSRHFLLLLVFDMSFVFTLNFHKASLIENRVDPCDSPYYPPPSFIGGCSRSRYWVGLLSMHNEQFFRLGFLLIYLELCRYIFRFLTWFMYWFHEPCCTAVGGSIVLYWLIVCFFSSLWGEKCGAIFALARLLDGIRLSSTHLIRTSFLIYCTTPSMWCARSKERQLKNWLRVFISRWWLDNAMKMAMATQQQRQREWNV